MKLLTIATTALFASLLFASPSSSLTKKEAEEAYQNQLKAYDEQLKENDRQNEENKTLTNEWKMQLEEGKILMERYKKILDRNEVLLDKKEEQAKRFDKILDIWEKQQEKNK